MPFIQSGDLFHEIMFKDFIITDDEREMYDEFIYDTLI